MPTEYVIPWAKPEFWGDEQQYVVEALSSQWISGGPFVDRLEAEFAKLNGTPYAVATSNGTTALHLAYLAVGIRPAMRSSSRTPTTNPTSAHGSASGNVAS